MGFYAQAPEIVDDVPIPFLESNWKLFSLYQLDVYYCKMYNVRVNVCVAMLVYHFREACWLYLPV